MEINYPEDIMTPITDIFFIMLFLKKIMFIFKEGKGVRKKGEKYQCVVASCAPLAEDLACNPGMCPDWELNR